MTLKQETIKNNKSTTRSNDNYGITWLRQTWHDYKIKRHMTKITTSERKLKVNSRKENAIPKEQPYSYE